MKTEFAPLLRCPVCRSDRSLVLEAHESDEREVRSGELVCGVCSARHPVYRGVAHLMYRPAAHVEAEAAGLERFAEQMRADGWDREMVLKLPYLEHGYWYVQARSMHQLLTTVAFAPGQTIIDVGSNTCWAANHFAERGLHAVALDIALTELQGLHTADYFLEAGRSYFERVLGSMDAIPLASDSLDYVYCSQVLHHNDPESLRRTFGEIFRVLRPGGKLLMVNETLKTLRDPHGVHDEEVQEYEGYEHAHWAARYRWEALRAGLLPSTVEPHYRAFFGDALAPPAEPGENRIRVVLRRRAFPLRRFAAVRRLYLAWLNDVWGGVSMNMIATKPRRLLGRRTHTSAVERVLRSCAAALLRPLERRRGRDEPPLPRTPEQAQERAAGPG